LTVADWTAIMGVALTITPVLEIGKWFVRRETFGKLD